MTQEDKETPMDVALDQLDKPDPPRHPLYTPAHGLRILAPEPKASLLRRAAPWLAVVAAAGVGAAILISALS
jgi:hypothetical protein